MINDKYVYIKENRLFVNTSLGCKGNCSYCYLPKIGYSNKKYLKKTKISKEIINFIEKSKININNKTLITLGCYSECFDKNNKKETIELLKYFLKKGNQIQLSTKEIISEKDIKEIYDLINYKGQLVIFISSATISKQKEIEINTTPIEKRLSNFLLLNKYNIPAVLYIKPVLKNITINDIELYIKYIKTYNIKETIVGSIFTEKNNNEPAPFYCDDKLYYNKIDDEEIIIKELSLYTNIYRRSTEVMKKYNRGEI